jgi:hypothetical protein
MGFFCAMKFFKYINILSLDVILASLAIAFMIDELHALGMHWSVYGALGSMVWLIYTFDHLMDAKTIGEDLISQRHQFHERNFKQIIYVWLAILLLSVFVLLPVLPSRTILYGVFASVFVIVHFVFVKLLGSKLAIWVQKEFGVALVFTLGVFVGPLSYVPEVDLSLFTEFTRLFLVAFFNLIMFSLFDLGIDQAQQQTSLTRYLGIKRTYLFLLGIDGLFLLTFLFNHFDSSFYFYSFILLFYNAMVFLKISIKMKERYRLVGDSILIVAAFVPFV